MENLWIAIARQNKIGETGQGWPVLPRVSAVKQNLASKTRLWYCASVQSVSRTYGANRKIINQY
jgi:hypothetical protein